MSDQPNHNKGFGAAFLWIILVMFILPVVAMMTLDDTFERFLQKYGDPFTTECWENSKHEKVKSNVSLVETFVSMKCIGGELSENHSWPMST